MKWINKLVLIEFHFGRKTLKFVDNHQKFCDMVVVILEERKSKAIHFSTRIIEVSKSSSFEICLKSCLTYSSICNVFDITVSFLFDTDT